MKFSLLQLLIVDGSAPGVRELGSGAVPNSRSGPKKRWSSPWQDRSLWDSHTTV